MTYKIHPLTDFDTAAKDAARIAKVLKKATKTVSEIPAKEFKCELGTFLHHLPTLKRMANKMDLEIEEAEAAKNSATSEHVNGKKK